MPIINGITTLRLDLLGPVGTGTAPPPPPFAPTDIAGIQFWVRGDKGITTIGGYVSQWNDQSGVGDANRNMVAAFPGEQPSYVVSDAGYNNQSTVSFIAANNVYMRTAGVLSADITDPSTWFIAANDDGSASRQFYFTTSPSGIPNLEVLSKELLWSNLDGPNSTGLPTVYAGLSNNTTSKLYQNALTPVSSGSQGGPGDVSSFFFGSNVGSGLFLNGKIAEMIIYSGILSPTDFAKVMNYLGTRYNITIGS
jgi:hypothetical protein